MDEARQRKELLEQPTQQWNTATLRLSHLTRLSITVSISAILPVLYTQAGTSGMIFNPLLNSITDSACSSFSALNPSQSLQRELFMKAFKMFGAICAALMAWSVPSGCRLGDPLTKLEEARHGQTFGYCILRQIAGRQYSLQESHPVMRMSSSGVPLCTRGKGVP